MAISGRVGAVFMQTATAPLVFTNKPTTGDAEYKRYRINDLNKRYWDKTFPTTVTVNGTPVTSGFELEHCGGFVVFQTALQPEDEVKISGRSITVAQRGGFFNWSCELSTELSDVTTFQSDGWKEHLPTMKGFTASAESYWGDSEFSKSVGKEVIIALYIDNGLSKKRYEGYAVISSDSIETAVDDVINESIEFEGTGKLFYRED
jgi:hypothetical protein